MSAPDEPGLAEPGPGGTGSHTYCSNGDCALCYPVPDFTGLEDFTAPPPAMRTFKIKVEIESSGPAESAALWDQVGMKAASLLEWCVAQMAYQPQPSAAARPQPSVWDIKQRIRLHPRDAEGWLLLLQSAVATVSWPSEDAELATAVNSVADDLWYFARKWELYDLPVSDGLDALKATSDGICDILPIIGVPTKHRWLAEAVCDKLGAGAYWKLKP